MKKLIYALCLVLLVPGLSWGRTCTALKAGNWSDGAGGVWSCDGNETSVPANGDNVALAGYVIVWDIATIPVIPPTGSLGTITSTGTAGQISIALDNAACHGTETCKITATTITAGTKPTNAGIIYITGTGTISDHILGIHANIVGGSNTSSSGVQNNGTGFVAITGTVTGGSGSSTTGFLNNSTGGFSVVGAVTGGSGSNAQGVTHGGTATGTIDGTVSGGSGSGAVGVSSASTGQLTLSATSNIIGTATAVGWSGRAPTWNPETTGYITMYVNSAATKFYFDVPAIANVVSPDTLAGVTGEYASAPSGGAWGF
jgi:hypothetical protein